MSISFRRCRGRLNRREQQQAIWASIHALLYALEHLCTLGVTPRHGVLPACLPACPGPGPSLCCSTRRHRDRLGVSPRGAHQEPIKGSGCGAPCLPPLTPLRVRPAPPLQTFLQQMHSKHSKLHDTLSEATSRMPEFCLK